jgi:hypothetical protein
MAGGQRKKRRKATLSSSSSSPSQPSQKKKKNQPTVNLIDDSEDNPAPTKINHPATDSTQPVKLQELTNEQELRKLCRLCSPYKLHG